MAPYFVSRGLGQAAGVVDVNPADYVNVGWDSAAATSMSQLDNNYNAGNMTQAVYVASAQAIVGALAPTGTVDENAADYAALGWSNSAAQMAANAGTALNAGGSIAAFQASMQQAVANIFVANTSTVAPSAANAAGNPPSGLTPQQQAAVDIAAINGAASVANTGIAAGVAAAKGTTLTMAAAGTGGVLAPGATAATAMTTNQKIGLAVAGAVVVGGIIWYVSSSKGGRRRRRR